MKINCFFLLLFFLLLPFNCIASNEIKDRIIVAYALDRDTTTPDVRLLTHIIYGFGDFNENFGEVKIKKTERLAQLSALKQMNPNLKVILGVTSSRKPGFSEMCADKKKRISFAKSCKNIMLEYNLDGVDLDWEFPTTEAGGHTASPNDKENYVLFVKELRKILGKDKWITIYSNNTGNWIDFPHMVPYLSYVNVSGYNLDKAPFHQSNLYPSNKCGEWSVSKVIERHQNRGVPKNKILLGIPFYGRGMNPFPSYIECKDFHKYNQGCIYKWDEDACAPYYENNNGELVLGFDDENSIKIKCDFIKDIDLPGVFYWNYDSDYTDHRLAKTILNNLK